LEAGGVTEQELQERAYQLFPRGPRGGPQYWKRQQWLEAELRKQAQAKRAVAEPMVRARSPFVNGFLVGCDPEFVALDGQGNLVNLRQRGMRAEGEVGYDHEGRVGELRPQAAKSTFTLVKRLQELLTGDGLKPVADAKLRAGAMIEAGGVSQPLGGHFHYDLRPPNEGDFLYEPSQTKEHQQRIAGLDALTQTLEHLDILPQKECEARRNQALYQYGRFGHWRPAGEKDQRTEYRTLASWLFDPAAAMLALTGAKLATVAPDVAQDKLKGEYKGLVGFFEAFRGKDGDATRTLEKLLDGKDVKALQAKPDAELREAWKELRI
jgi:hypothetical protein